MYAVCFVPDNTFPININYNCPSIFILYCLALITLVDITPALYMYTMFVVFTGTTWIV